MKVETKKSQEEVFEPVVLTITIESKKELLDLLSRTQACATSINEGCFGGSNQYAQADNESCEELFLTLDAICDERNIQ
jgi:hypothetical protein